MLDLDNMLFHVGEFGLYQKRLFLLQAPFCFFVTFVTFGQIFMMLYPVNYWCESHFDCLTWDSVATSAQRRNISFAWRTGLFRNDPCHLNDINENFLDELDSWDKRNCGRDARRRPCIYIDQSSEPVHSSQRKLPSPPSWFNYKSSRRWAVNEDQRETEIYRRKRSYGTFGAFRDPVANYPPRTTTTDSSVNNRFKEERSNGFETYGGQRANGNQDKPWYVEPVGESDFGHSGYHPVNSYHQHGRKPSWSNFNNDDRRNPDWHEFNSTSSGSNTDVAKVFGGWPEPNCNQETRRRFSLGNDTIILAERMQRRFQNKSWENIEQCSKVRWNRSDLPYETIVTQGNWWCNAEIYTAFSQGIFFLGAIVGGIVMGQIADKFGRVPALVTANILGAVGGALSATSTNVWAFSFFRFITGMSFDNCFTMMYILVLEYCGPSYRTLVANVSISIFYTLGTLTVPFLAWLINDWRIFSVAISFPMLLGIFAPLFVPESARWLLSKGRVKEATNIFRNIAKVNKTEVDEKIFTNFEQEATKLYSQLEQEKEEPGVTAALRTPRLRRTFILLSIFWALIALVYESHSRNIINLANEQLNVFWMFGIASMTELPADMFLIFTINRLGRRWLAFGSMALAGAFSFIAAVITPSVRAGFLIAVITSRFWVNVAFNMGIQYAAELLPTVIRAQGVTTIHDIGYLASILSPFVAVIGRSNPAISLVLLGAFAMAAAFASLFLAETLGEDLPNSLEDAENLGINQRFLNCPVCVKDQDDVSLNLPRIVVEEETLVLLKNALQGRIRGEMYRSSTISNASSGGSSCRQSHSFRPGNNNFLQVPEPIEMSRLRRVTH